jgi:hypothetical protein
MAEINLTPAVVVWVILAVATLGLALYRKLISASEEDLIHLGPGEERQIPAQVALAEKLKVKNLDGNYGSDRLGDGGGVLISGVPGAQIDRYYCGAVSP